MDPPGLGRLFEAGAAEDRVEAQVSELDETKGHHASHEREADVAVGFEIESGRAGGAGDREIDDLVMRGKHVGGAHWRIIVGAAAASEISQGVVQPDENLTVLDCDRRAGRLERLVLVVEHKRNRAALARDHHEPRKILEVIERVNIGAAELVADVELGAAQDSAYGR